MIKKLYLLAAFMVCHNCISQIASQNTYEHISNERIYDFLDELANQGMIHLNSTVKPYSRQMIANALREAEKHQALMGKRQQTELRFYLSSFFLELGEDPASRTWRHKTQYQEEMGVSHPAFQAWYRDTLFKLLLRPVAGIYFYNNSSGTIKHRWGGAEAHATLGRHLGVYASLRDNNESEKITSPLFFNSRQGVPMKNFGDEGYDYSEMRGGITFSWKWGSVGLIKDHVVWGDNYHGSNILSGRTPSFPFITFKLKPTRWLEFNYIHGWLVSSVVDSSRSYWDDYVYRPVFHEKYLAANLLTVTPLKRLNISFGNSIVYSDLGVHAAYLNPFMFYKSVDHTLNGTNSRGETGQNAQMFASISSRQIKGLHIFTSIFFDELNISRIKNGLVHNFFSFKAGARSSGILYKNLTLTAEYTLTKPLTYAHKISTTTFESNEYNLGHYLRDNSKELYLSVLFKPLAHVYARAEYIYAGHYNDYVYDTRPGIVGDPPFQDLTWQQTAAGMEIGWEFAANAGIRVSYTFTETKGFDVDGKTSQYYLDRYTPQSMQGKVNTLMAGIYVGF